MGQAKRRKQLDPTYGQFYQLASVDDKERHFDLLWNGFFEQLTQQAQRLFSSRKTLDFDRLSLHLSNWFKCQMKRYQPQDRETLATLILTVYLSAPEDSLGKCLGLKYLIETLWSFLPEDSHPQALKLLEKANREISHKLALRSAILGTAKGIEQSPLLTLNYPSTSRNPFLNYNQTIATNRNSFLPSQF